MPEPAHHQMPLAKVILPRILTGASGLVVFALLWFGLAGRLTWLQGWAFLVTFTAYSGVLAWQLSRRNPDLLRERNQPASRAEPWDRVLMRMYGIALVILLLLSALDGGRYHWSSVPLAVQLIGWFLLIAAGLIVWHVMMTNTYLSSWARLQGDRGQVVIEEGAYQCMRHPMYLGIIIAFLGIPFALGSWWAAIPSLIIVGLFGYRTYREDRMLMNGLVGYAEYAERVRHRLLPGVW